MGHTLIYGGTFDPVHHGHLITCQRAREMLSADRVLFIPAYVSPHKRERRFAAGEHRLAMLHRAIAGHAFFVADGRELQRGEAEEDGGRPSYTIETIEELRHEMPGERWTLLMGADQLPGFHTWHRVGELVDMLEIAVLGRVGNGGAAEGMKAVAEHLGERVAKRMRLLHTPLVEISATEIRERVREGLPLDFLLPVEVADYIEQHGLYRTE